MATSDVCYRVLWMNQLYKNVFHKTYFGKAVHNNTILCKGFKQTTIVHSWKYIFTVILLEAYYINKTRAHCNSLQAERRPASCRARDSIIVTANTCLESFYSPVTSTDRDRCVASSEELFILKDLWSSLLSLNKSFLLESQRSIAPVIACKSI